MIIKDEEEKVERQSKERSDSQHRFSNISRPIASNILSSDAFTKYLFEKSSRDFKQNPAKISIKAKASEERS